MAGKKFNAMPGFGLTMGYTMLYLSLIVLIPIGGLFLRVFEVALNSPDLTVKDLEESAALIDRLQKHEDPVSTFLWTQFSEPVRQGIIAGGGGELTRGFLQTNLAPALNAVLRSESLDRTALFPDDILSAKTKWLRQHSAPGKSAAWLNRSLLEDALGGDIKKKANWLDLWLLATADRSLAAYKLTIGASLLAAIVNAVFGTLLAWVLTRYEFPGRRFIDAMVDFPFALPTAVAGLTLANLFATNGWLGRFLARPNGAGSAVANAAASLDPITLYMPWFGVVVALTFVGMPFVVRTLQPVIENFEREVEESAATLGSGRLRTFLSVIAPSLLPSIITGFALAFARAIGEYGSVVFISGNMPFKSEIAPQLIFIRLEEFNYPGAMTLAVVLLVFSFALLVLINVLEQWASKFVKG